MTVLYTAAVYWWSAWQRAERVLQADITSMQRQAWRNNSVPQVEIADFSLYPLITDFSKDTSGSCSF